MNIDLKMIYAILERFEMAGEVHQIIDYIHYIHEEDEEVKLIFKVEFTNRNPIVIKILKEKEHPFDKIESQSRFSEYLRSKGIWTPKRYLCEGKYCLIYHWQGMDLAVTVEDYLGEEIKKINFPLAYSIGELLGRMHRITEEGQCEIGTSTIFDLFGYNELSGYETFQKLGTVSQIDAVLYKKINDLYKAKMANIQRMWHQLPRFATQGDLSINNLTYAHGEVGVFDYNIAGDERLVADMVLEGLLVANEMDLDDQLTNQDRLKLFEKFYNGYMKERPLSVQEQAVVEDIFIVSSAMWFTKIKYHEDALENLVARHAYDQVQEKLQEIYNALQGK